MSKGGLEALLHLIQGKSGILGPGIRTYTIDDPRHKPLHEACLELERQGKIVRQIEEGDMVLWMPREEAGTFRRFALRTDTNL